MINLKEMKLFALENEMRAAAHKYVPREHTVL